MDGNRKWPRVPVRLDLQLLVGGDTLLARTLNVSREGLFIVMDPPRPLGTEVRLRIEEAATGEIFALEGVVVHTVPDLDDPDDVGKREPTGIGIFLTQACEGWVGYCDRVAEAAAIRLGPPTLAGSRVEIELEVGADEFADNLPTERELLPVARREDK